MIKDATCKSKKINILTATMRLVVLVFALVLTCSNTAFAQWYAASYHANAGNPGGLITVNDDNFAAWTPFTGMTLNATANAWSNAVAIPFGFDYFNQAVTTVRVTYNGLLTFGAGGASPSANEILPTASLPDQTIACFWDEFPGDGDTGPDDYVIYRTVGTTPNRQFWVRWQNMDHGNPTVGTNNNFAIVLEETTHNIYLVDMRSENAANLNTTIGLQNTSDCAAAWSLDSVATDGTNTVAAADNDYYQFVPAATFQGTYTIGGATPDYPNLSNAAALLGCGITGPVEFQVEAGTYTEQVRIPTITGVSATDTVWIHSTSGDSTDVQWTYPSNADASKNYLLFLDGADYVTIEGMTLERTGNDTYGQVVCLGNSTVFRQSANIRLYRNHLSGIAGTTQATHDVVKADFQYNDLQILQNRITGGYQSVYTYATFPDATGVVVAGNEISGAYMTSLRINTAAAPVITANEIDGTTGAVTNRGIDFQNCDGPVYLIGNKVAVNGVGIYSANLTDTGTASEIVNNMASAGNQAISLAQSVNVNIHHNNFQADNPGTAAVLVGAACSALDFRNNLMHHSNTLAGFALEVNNINPLATIFSAADFNGFSGTVGDLVRYNAVDYADLTTWQGVSGLEANSVFAYPDFDETDGLYAQSPEVAMAGTPILTLPLDIDGLARNVTNPSMGANEFAPEIYDNQVNTCVPFDPITSNGSGRWQFLYAEGEVVAAINDNGNNLGTITGEVYLHNGALRQDSYSNLFLDRNFHIAPTSAPASDVSVRLYFLDSEFTTLAGADPLVTTSADLSVTRYNGSNQNCDLYDNPSITGAGYTTNAPGLNTQGTLLGAEHFVQTDVPAFSEFYISSTGVVLPVEGLSLFGEEAEGAVHLGWEGAYAEQLDYFEVLRSANGIDFEAIGRVGVNQPTLVNEHFDYQDHGASDQGSERLFYRLNSVDLDGKSQLSQVVEISLKEADFEATLLPNPASGQVEIRLSQLMESPAYISILDSQGRMVLRRIGEQSQVISLEDWPSGVYLVRIQQNGKVRHQRLLVK